MPEGLEFCVACPVAILFIIIIGIGIFVYLLTSKTNENPYEKDEWNIKSILLAILGLIMGAIGIFMGGFAGIHYIQYGDEESSLRIVFVILSLVLIIGSILSFIGVFYYGDKKNK